MTFLDTNVILRYLTWDDAKKANRCAHLFQRVAAGKETLTTSTLVIADVIWTLEKAYKLSRSKIAEIVAKILNTPNIELQEKEILLATLRLYELKKIDFIDAYHAISMQAKDISSLHSYDTDFDSIPSLKRLEP